MIWWALAIADRQILAIVVMDRARLFSVAPLVVWAAVKVITFLRVL